MDPFETNDDEDVNAKFVPPVLEFFGNRDVITPVYQIL